MSISFLNAQNFTVVGSRQKTLGINLPGNVFVFFKMQGCDNCAQFDPIFAALSRSEGRVSCAILDITQNRDVVLWSRNTSTPITAVPVLVLYIDGRPHAKFNGTRNILSIQAFITKALQQKPVGSSQQQFMPHQPPSHQGQSNMYGGGYAGGGNPGGATQSSGKPYMPEIGTAPSMKGIIKGYAAGANVEDEEESRLLLPDTVIPHNAPWEAELHEGQM
jgi:hypothetical protein